MFEKSVQENAEILEELIEKETKRSRLTLKEFNALNNIMLYLQTSGVYKLPERFDQISKGGK
jgi:hypothetical protein